MNLSILIPCYNWDIYQFIKDLHHLCQKTKELTDFEIICLEDGSSIFFSNNKISKLKKLEYQVIKHNIGRSAIRNLLAKKAKYSWLLFIDCDSKIETPKFIKNYIDQIQLKEAENTVYYGETIYENTKSKKEITLHKKYGFSIESKRKSHVFSSHHFLIHKLNFEKNKFDEKIKSYGYEDVLFQIQSKLSFKHIHNPLYHTGLKNTNDFIKDCESGLKNISQYASDKDVIDKIKILQYWKIISSIHLDRVIVILFKLFKRVIIKNLHSSNPSLYLFQFYKLAFFCQLNIDSMKKRD